MRSGDESALGADVGPSTIEVEQLAAMKRTIQTADSVVEEVSVLISKFEFDCGGAIPKCREEVEALWLVADGGCDIKLRDRLEAHFAHCSYCHAQYEIEVRIKELLSKKCKPGPCAPESLKEKLRSEIRMMLTVSHPRSDTALDAG